ncbi:hypothetical protein BC332_33473 [Capsicum chinense]|nr:hypothetical protein BC332_33473 [Capsicum chinense]
MEGEKQRECCTVFVPALLTLRECLARCGLICILVDHRFYLSNPAIKQIRELPGCSSSACSGNDKVVGFGYLHSKREYKVINFFYRGPSCSFRDGQLKHLKCEILTLNEVGGISNGWKEIARRPPYHPDITGLLVNECMYWFANLHDYYRPVDQIVALDFENAKFLTISRPSCFEYLYGLEMMDLKGMLCLHDANLVPCGY